MADINGAVFQSSSSEAPPTMKYKVTYTKSRPSNTQMRYVFTIQTSMNNYDWLGTGHTLVAKITVNGVSGTATLKTSSETWKNVGPHSTDTITITCGSTGVGTQVVSFSVTNSYNGFGQVSNSSYTVTSSALLGTKCTPPKNFKQTPQNSDGLCYLNEPLLLTWDQGDGGSNNAFKYTQIQISAAGDIPWADVGNYTTESLSKTNGYYWNGKNIVYRARTVGTMGESMASDWVLSNYLRQYPRKPNNVTVRHDSQGYPSETGDVYSAYDGDLKQNIDIIQLSSNTKYGEMHIIIDIPVDLEYTYVELQYACWTSSLNPLTDEPDSKPWTSMNGQITTETTKTYWDDYRPNGTWMRFRARTVWKATGATEIDLYTPWVYSKVERLGGLLSYNNKSTWDKSPVFVKVNNQWKRAACVYRNVNGKWKKSY